MWWKRFGRINGYHNYLKKLGYHGLLASSLAIQCLPSLWNSLFLSWNSYRVLRLSGGLDEAGQVNWDLALCLLLAWIVCYLCVCKGIKSSGKVRANFLYKLIYEEGCVFTFLLSIFLTVHLGSSPLLGPSVCLPVFLSVCPCVGLSVLLSFCVFACPCVRPLVRLYICPSVGASICLSVCLSVSTSVRLSIFAFVRPSICLSAYLFMRPSVSPSVCLSVRSPILTSAFPCVFLLICLSVSPSVCLFVCLSDWCTDGLPDSPTLQPYFVLLSVCLSTRQSLLSSVCLSFCSWSFLRSTVLLICRLCISLPQPHISYWRQS